MLIGPVNHFFKVFIALVHEDKTYGEYTIYGQTILGSILKFLVQLKV